jgi:hypothetical protein
VGKSMAFRFPPPKKGLKSGFGRVIFENPTPQKVLQ